MDKLEAIRTAHLIDQHFGSLTPAVPDEGLQRKILAVQAEWRELAYAITARLCGVDSTGLSGTPRKRANRKRGDDPGEHAGARDGDGLQLSDGGAE